MLRNMPCNHPDRAGLVRRLEENEKVLTESQRFSDPCSIPMRDSCSTRFVVPGEDDFVRRRDRRSFSTNMPSSDSVSSTKTPYPATVSPLQPPVSGDGPNKFTFDLCHRYGFQDFDRWIDETPDLANPIREIAIKFHTWAYNDMRCMWSAIDSETTFSLLTSGSVNISHSNISEASAKLCRCDDEECIDEDQRDEKGEEEEEGCNSVLALASFAQALSQDDSHLIDAASKFVDLIDGHDAMYETISCHNCGKHMFSSRTYRLKTIHPELMPDSGGMLCSADTSITASAATARNPPLEIYGQNGFPLKEAIPFQEDYCSLLDAHPTASQNLKTAESQIPNGNAVSHGLPPNGVETLSPSTKPVLNRLIVDVPTTAELESTLPASPSRTPKQTSPFSPDVKTPESASSGQRASGDDHSSISTAPSTVECSPPSSEVTATDPEMARYIERYSTRHLSNRISSLNLRIRKLNLSAGHTAAEARGLNSSVEDINARIEADRSGGRSLVQKLIARLKRRQTEV